MCTEIVAGRFHCGACSSNFKYEHQPSYCPECGMNFTHYEYLADLLELVKA